MTEDDVLGAVRQLTPPPPVPVTRACPATGVVGVVAVAVAVGTVVRVGVVEGTVVRVGVLLGTAVRVGLLVAVAMAVRVGVAVGAVVRVAVAVGAGVEGWTVIVRYWAETQPAWPLQMTGCQPLLAVPLRVTVAPSGSATITL